LIYPGKADIIRFLQLIAMTAVTATRLTDWTLLRYTGADASTFLHGQLTCDVQALKPGASSYGGYCTPKGRLLATFLLWADADGFMMLLPAALAEAIRKRLSMYVLRSKVKIEDVTAQQACIGVSGSESARDIAALGGTLPERQHGVTFNGAVRVVYLPQRRYLAVVPQAPAQIPDDSGAWAAADIAAGIPFIVPATQEEFVPQMVNLDLIGGLSYSKGCYPGQEIVARTHYLGRLKQRMFRASTDAAAQAGDKLYSSGLGDQSCGMIVAATPSGNGSEVLAVLRLGEEEAVHLHSLQGAVLQITNLPYKVT